MFEICIKEKSTNKILKFAQVFKKLPKSVYFLITKSFNCIKRY